jgi:hypothetical protein
MIYVELLKDVAEGGRDLAVVTKAAKDMGFPAPQIKRTHSRGVTTIYRKGAIVTMLEASADKWVKSGLCRAVEAPKSAPMAISGKAV